MSKNRHQRDYDDDSFERRARRRLKHSMSQDDSDWKFDPRRNYTEDDDEQENQAQAGKGYHSRKG